MHCWGFSAVDLGAQALDLECRGLAILEQLSESSLPWVDSQPLEDVGTHCVFLFDFAVAELPLFGGERNRIIAEHRGGRQSRQSLTLQFLGTVVTKVLLASLRRNKSETHFGDDGSDHE